jgi:hypothetical protein
MMTLRVERNVVVRRKFDDGTHLDPLTLDCLDRLDFIPW